MNYYSMADIERIGPAGCLQHMNELHEANSRLEDALEDARKATAEFDRLRLLACQEVERIAPIARESGLLRWDLFSLNTAYNGLQERFDKDQERFAKDRESLAALAGCARDNNWQGVSEGLHAYAWQAFLDAKIGKADQIRRWASLWKQVAKKRFSRASSGKPFDPYAYSDPNIDPEYWD